MTQAVDLGQVANNFFQSFYAAKQFKQVKKEKQNEVIIQAALAQLRDDTIPLKERNNLFNAIAEMAGGKKGIDYAGQIGLRHLENQDVQVGTETKTIPTNIVGGNPDKTQIPVGGFMFGADYNKPNSTDLTQVINQNNQGYGGINPNSTAPQETINQPPIMVSGSKEVTSPVFKKRGDLSPLNLQELAKKAERSQVAEDELKKQLIIKQMFPNYETFIKTDKDGNRTTVLVDKANPTNMFELPQGLIPVSSFNTAARNDTPKGKLLEYLQAASGRLGKPITDPEVIEAAQKDLDKYHQDQSAFLTGQVTRVENTNTGNTPPSQAEEERLRLAREEAERQRAKDAKDERQKALNVFDAYVKGKSAKEAAFTKKQSIAPDLERTINKGQEIDANIQSLLNAGVKETDKRINSLRKQAKDVATQYKDLKTAYDTAQENETNALSTMESQMAFQSIFPNHLKTSRGNNNYPIMEVIPEDAKPTNIQGYTDKEGKTYGGGEAYVVDNKTGLLQGQTLAPDAQRIVDAIRQQRPNETKGHSDWEIWQDYKNRSKR